MVLAPADAFNVPSEISDINSPCHVRLIGEKLAGLCPVCGECGQRATKRPVLFTCLLSGGRWGAGLCLRALRTYRLQGMRMRCSNVGTLCSRSYPSPLPIRSCFSACQCFCSSSTMPRICLRILSSDLACNSDAAIV